MYLGLGFMLIGFIAFVIARWLTGKKQNSQKKCAVVLVDVSITLFEGNALGLFFALLLKKFGCNFNTLSVLNFIVLILFTIILVYVSSHLFFLNERIFELARYYHLASNQDYIDFVNRYLRLPVIASAIWFILYAFLFK